MGFRVSTTNKLRSLSAANITAPAAATGYAATDLCDGTMAAAYRTAAGATQHDLVFTGVAGPCSFLAVFGVQMSAGLINSVKLYADGFIVNINSLTLNSRGDGCMAFSSRSASTWTVRITPSSSVAKLTVGEIWLGEGTTLTRAPTSYPLTRRSGVLVNGDFAEKSEPYRVHLGLAFDRMLSASHDEMVAVYDAAEGQLNQIVVQPDSTDGAQVFMGRLTTDPAWSLDYPVYSGHTFDFLEGRRSLG